jgi:hypothetical protein
MTSALPTLLKWSTKLGSDDDISIPWHDCEIYDKRNEQRLTSLEVLAVAGTINHNVNLQELKRRKMSHKRINWK